ncbi:hypothetical protein EV2_009276 [Malus domestica]
MMPLLLLKGRLPKLISTNANPGNFIFIFIFLCWKCSDTGTYTLGDMYQKNLNSLLSSFTTNTEISSGSGFTIFPRDKTPTKSTPLHCAEETSFMTLAIHFSMTL